MRSRDMRPVSRDNVLAEHVIEPAACVGLSSEIHRASKNHGLGGGGCRPKTDL